MSSKLPYRWQAAVIQLLSVAGIFVAFYLWLYHRGDLIVVCHSGGWDDCGKVSGPGAPYSEIAGIPVALMGLLGYITIFLAIWLQDWSEWVSDNLPDLLIALVGVSLLFSVGLTGLELFVIHAFCRYCVVSAIIIVIMSALTWHLIRDRNKE